MASDVPTQQGAPAGIMQGPGHLPSFPAPGLVGLPIHIPAGPPPGFQRNQPSPGNQPFQSQSSPGSLVNGMTLTDASPGEKLRQEVVR